MGLLRVDFFAAGKLAVVLIEPCSRYDEERKAEILENKRTELVKQAQAGSAAAGARCAVLILLPLAAS